MNIKRLVILAGTVLLHVSALACWFTEEGFNDSYIEGVNNHSVHYYAVGVLSEAIYYNDMTVAHPLTVKVKLTPLHADKPLIEARLQYKSATSKSWTTIKTIRNPPAYTNMTLPFFGDIPINTFPANTVILIRLYVTDGVNESGDLGVDIDSSSIGKLMTSESEPLPGGWTPPFVMRVVYNGKQRPW